MIFNSKGMFRFILQDLEKIFEVPIIRFFHLLVLLSLKRLIFLEGQCLGELFGQIFLKFLEDGFFLLEISKDAVAETLRLYPLLSTYGVCEYTFR